MELDLRSWLYEMTVFYHFYRKKWNKLQAGMIKKKKKVAFGENCGCHEDTGRLHFEKPVGCL